MRRFFILVLTMAVSSVVAVAPAQARNADVILYEVKRGDTLIALARSYFISDRHIAAVQRINSIRNPRRIPVGKQLKLPRNFLRYDMVPLQVRAFSGPVQLVADGRTGQAALGAQLGEGDEISTGRSGFVSLTGVDGARVSLPSNSRARIVSARRYLLGEILDVDVRILDGRGNVIAPKLKDGERFNVGTPVAVTAVRGTEFRVSYDAENSLGGTEVTEGLVDVITADAEGAVDGVGAVAPEGFGVVSTTTGVRPPEELLPATELIEPGKIQTAEVAEFEIESQAGARGYRTQIARDPSFLEVIAESVGESTTVSFADLPNGRFAIRTRAIAESGLEGLSETFDFRRKRLGASASVETSPLDDAFKFGWLSEGEGQAYQAFQLWRDGAVDSLIVDEVGLVDTAIFVGALEPAVYHWRVGTFQIDEGDVIKVWGPTQKLTVTE